MKGKGNEEEASPDGLVTFGAWVNKYKYTKKNLYFNLIKIVTMLNRFLLRRYKRCHPQTRKILLREQQ